MGVQGRLHAAQIGKLQQALPGWEAEGAGHEMPQFDDVCCWSDACFIPTKSQGLPSQLTMHRGESLCLALHPAGKV